MVYGDAHRLFLQLMTHRRSLDEREATQLMERCCKEFRVKAKNLEGFVLELNLELKHMQLVVRSAMEEREDGDYPCLVLANLMASDATRELSSFTKQELTFMQQLVVEMVTSEKGEVEINTALNIGPRLPQKLKPSTCEDLVEHLVADKWLIKGWDDDGGECLSLSALSITELAAYLEETFPEDVHKCFFCTKLTVKGYRCDQCNISVHRDCGKKYWADRNSYECPGERCSASLRDQVVSGHGQTKRRRTRNADQEDENMDEVETEEEEEEVEEVVKKGKGKVSPRKSRGREKNGCE